MTTSLRDHFLLDPDIVFLNHGSFGATPRPVFETYQAWQRRLEAQPVKFLGRDIGGYLAEARRQLGAYVNAAGDDLVYVPNVTHAVNIVARSLALGPGDEVLASDHEYGACDRAWRYLAGRHGFTYRRQSIDLPLTTPDAIVEQFWTGVTSRTRVIFLSHITSATAVRMPVEVICARARAAGILTLIDGAHVAGQIPLDLAAVGADFYAGNAHKWLCAPKGAGFLHARRERQGLIEPLIVGWGWGDDRPETYGSDFLDFLQWQGTSDYAAALSVPAAIRFQSDHDWERVRETCHGLLCETLERIGRLTGLPAAYPPGDDTFFRQMAIAPLPPIGDLRAFKSRLYDDFRVEAPCTEWNGRPFIRICFQGYNTEADADALLIALRALLS